MEAFSFSAAAVSQHTIGSFCHHGDFAAGIRRVTVPNRGDFAVGLRRGTPRGFTGSFATGLARDPGHPLVQGDFASGMRGVDSHVVERTERIGRRNTKEQLPADTDRLSGTPR